MSKSWVNALRVIALVNIALAAQTWHNTRSLREPSHALPNPSSTELISVLVPARNEAKNIDALMRCLAAQDENLNLEILVADDDSLDETAQLIKRWVSRAEINRPVRLIEITEPLPRGWLGKTWACHTLATEAKGSVLIFLDADVRLSPNAIAQAVEMLRASHLSLLSPYPKQVTSSGLARLIQPLLQWSWLTFLPLNYSEKPRTSVLLAAANGQFLVCDANAYRAVRGHAAVAGEVIDDVELARAFKSHGFQVGMADGASMASCQMYETNDELIEGYSKSLWRAFGSPFGGVVASLGLLALYVLPAAAAIGTSDSRARNAGVIGYLAGVTQRVLAAKKTESEIWPATVLQPVSIAALVTLIGVSIIKKSRGGLTWRGRSL
jgi:GT2 family glycosyltransferase